MFLWVLCIVFWYLPDDMMIFCWPTCFCSVGPRIMIVFRGKHTTVLWRRVVACGDLRLASLLYLRNLMCRLCKLSACIWSDCIWMGAVESRMLKNSCYFSSVFAWYECSLVVLNDFEIHVFMLLSNLDDCPIDLCDVMSDGSLLCFRYDCVVGCFKLC